jgi:7-carboxy-7-deazaguanine synthase
MFPVNEIYQSVHDCARWAGTPAVIVKVQGCSVGCGWCNERQTWVLDQKARVQPKDVVDKSTPSPSWADMTDDMIVVEVMQHRARHVVITGGEPCLYDLKVLCRMLQTAGCMVQVETSGTQVPRVSRGTWLTVAPKAGMPGKFDLRGEAIMRADEIVMPVTATKDVKTLTHILETHPDWTGDVWLQPVHGTDKATALCVDAATRGGYRIAAQHPIFRGIR